MAPGTVGHRQKRSQVVRACDWCRQHRSKCDNSVPCGNCRTRGERCSNDASRETSLPSARWEIERLRRQVQELESELSTYRDQQRLSNLGFSSAGLTPPSSTGPPESSLAEPVQTSPTHAGSTRNAWGGVKVRATRSSKASWYGPSSLYYFIGCVSRFLNSRLPEPTRGFDNVYEFDSAGVLFSIANDPTETQGQSHAPTGSGSSGTVLATVPTQQSVDSSAQPHELSPVQEDSFINLYWQSYHCTNPIIDEADFKEHYRSLWSQSGGQTRAPSALVDIVLATGMQFGASSMAAGMRQERFMFKDDAATAGLWYYRRSRFHLQDELESPSLRTLQCYILCGIYLCNASFHNTADSLLGHSVRQAISLGLHLEPGNELSSRERELRKRIWWCLCTLDNRVGIKNGRPFIVASTGPAPLLPSDALDVAMDTGSSFAPLGNGVTWLSFTVHHTKLFQAARAAHTSFFDSGYSVPDGTCICSNASALEFHANILLTHQKILDHWVEQVPKELTNARPDGGQPLSTGGSSMLQMQPFAPLWLQAQRIVLELTYHNVCINLYRPLISVLNPPPLNTPACRVVWACLLHAVTLTKMMHQLMSSTNILNGYYEAFLWQWNAAMTLIGYLLAYPLCHSASEARSTVDTALEVFDIYGDSLTVAKSASKIIRRLRTQADLLTQKSQEEANLLQKRTGGAGGSRPDKPVEPAIDQTPFTRSLDWNMELDPSQLEEIMSMSFDIDQATELAALWS